MKSIKFKFNTKAVFILLFVVYLIFPTSAFFGEKNKLFENANSDGTLKVVVYKIELYNLFSLYKFLTEEIIFLLFMISVEMWYLNLLYGLALAVLQCMEVFIFLSAIKIRFFFRQMMVWNQ